MTEAGLSIIHFRSDSYLDPDTLERGRALVSRFGPVFAVLESVAFVSAYEWMRRIIRTAALVGRWNPDRLLRIAQGLILINLLTGVFMPVQRTTSVIGVVHDPSRLLEPGFYLYAGPMFISLLLAAVAGTALVWQRPDSLETVRTNALGIAAPFLMSGMFVTLSWWAAVLTAIGACILLYGIFRYQTNSGQREQFLSRFLSPQVSQLVRERGIQQAMKRESRTISVICCDLRGFTEFSERHDADTVVNMLARFYAALGEVAGRYGATVKDHAGDGLLILVGAPVAHGDEPERALTMARDMQRAHTELRDSATGEAPPGMGVGIATGPVVVGAIQAAEQLEYVAVGRTVNLAARLCSQASVGEIWLDEPSFSAQENRDDLSAAGTLSFKGLGDGVSAWRCAV